MLDGLRDAAALLLLDPARRPGEPSAALVRWVVPLGLLIGLAWAATFRGAWRLYGEVAGLRLLPALAVVLLEALLTGRYLTLALSHVADTLDRASPDPQASQLDDLSAPLRLRGALILMLLVLVQWTLIVSIPVVNPWWPPPGDWRSAFNFLYPQPIYRPLLLAPLWGRWSILLAASIGRTAHGADALVAAACGRMTPARLLRQAVVPLLLSCVYFSRERNFLIGAVMALGVLTLSYLSAVALARRCGGQTRITLLATGQIGQIGFLAVYRALWGHIYL